MQVGVVIPWWVDDFGYDAVLRAATSAEQLGYDAVWFVDHVVVPPSQLENLGTTWFEVLTLMANIAGRTERISLGTDVIVAPYRHPVLAAKMLATLDVVSEGRLLIGVGSGFSAEEFEALGADFATRGARTDECIRVWKSVWRGDGPFAVDPKPLQQPHPPLLIGNRGPPVLRRVAALGDGWHPVGLDFDKLRDGMQRLESLWREHGRSGAPVLSYGGSASRVGDELAPAERPLLSGSPAQVTDDLVRLRELGCRYVVFRLRRPGGTLAEYFEQVELIATDVLPGIR